MIMTWKAHRQGGGRIYGDRPVETLEEGKLRAYRRNLWRMYGAELATIPMTEAETKRMTQLLKLKLGRPSKVAAYGPGAIWPRFNIMIADNGQLQSPHVRLGDDAALFTQLYQTLLSWEQED